ncbi:low temperature requirement protein A [Micromonospora endolithica]|uniref:Low temperature requirement protein A n=1 Tax=Micromonospora endolithica TaxID=230091 RepID=A0A3A9ZPB3_9ACTN|nr:low temperature requirement protein A [Micromonospora endolithica]RKN49386.1 low temperature requirement protein A [Micromonospora endolithica]TWJ23577.1 low temperature requirement protein LtrA [Micromonospora endolithica]
MRNSEPVAHFGRIHLAEPAAGVSRLELFVDLVFVYAFLNVTSVTAEQFNLAGVPRGMLLLALLWWCWVHYAWLGNAVRLTRGALPAVMFGLTATLLVMALTVREAFVDRPGGLPGPLVFALGYVVVRGGPLLVTTLALRHDAGKLRQFRRAWRPAAAGMLLLLASAILPGMIDDRLVRDMTRFGLVVLALAVDYGGIFVIGTGAWRLRSIPYWAERHSLIILIGFGETIISIGLSQGAAVAQPLTWSVIAGVLVSVLLVGLLWWTYFDVARFAAEQALERLSGARRARLARDAYSYLHLPMMAGLILVSLGLKTALTQLRIPSEPTLLGPLVLYGGVALYLTGLFAFEARTLRIVGRSPLVGVVLSIGLLPVATGLPVLGQLALLVAATGTMALADATVFRRRHHRLHQHIDLAGEKGSGVTPKELFLDLVFVYAFLQVSALLAEDPTWSGLLRGMLVLTVLWWAWCAYVWLAGAIRSEAAVVRVMTVVVVAVTAVISIAVPQALADVTGGLPGPLVFVACYAAIRLSQVAALGVTAWRERDPDRRAQALATMWPSLLALAVLLAAALVPQPVGDIRLLSPLRAGLWLVAIAIDLGGVRLVDVARWRIWSAPHWCERFGLIVIIGLGEALIAIGTAVAYSPVSGRIVLAAVLGTALLGGLWWTYFGGDADVGEHVLAGRTGRTRIALARDAYAYLHLPMIAGIVLISLGLRKTMGGLGAQPVLVASPPLGAVPHLALFGGVLLYLVAVEGYWRIVTGRLRRRRLLTAAAVAALIPVTAGTGPLAALGVLVATVLLLVAFEAPGDRKRGDPDGPAAPTGDPTSRPAVDPGAPPARHQ